LAGSESRLSTSYSHQLSGSQPPLQAPASCKHAPFSYRRIPKFAADTAAAARAIIINQQTTAN